MAITYLSFRYFYCVNAYKLWTIYYIKIVYLSGVGPVRYIIKDNQYFVCMIPGLVLSSITNQPLIFCESKTRRCYFVSLIVVNDFNSSVVLALLQHKSMLCPGLFPQQVLHISSPWIRGWKVFFLIDPF